MKITTIESTSSDETSYDNREIPDSRYHEIAKIKSIEDMDQDRFLPSFFALVTDELDSDEAPCMKESPSFREHRGDEVPMQPIPLRPLHVEIKPDATICSAEIIAQRHSDIASLMRPCRCGNDPDEC
jgi:hypothetical protein